MKSILFLAVMAMSIVACDTPENTGGTTDTDTPSVQTDTSNNNMNRTDTSGTNPSDTLQ